MTPRPWRRRSPAAPFAAGRPGPGPAGFRADTADVRALLATVTARPDEFAPKYVLADYLAERDSGDWRIDALRLPGHLAALQAEIAETVKTPGHDYRALRDRQEEFHHARMRLAEVGQPFVVHLPGPAKRSLPIRYRCHDGLLAVSWPTPPPLPTPALTRLAPLAPWTAYLSYPLVHQGDASVGLRTLLETQPSPLQVLRLRLHTPAPADRPASLLAAAAALRYLPALHEVRRVEVILAIDGIAYPGNNEAFTLWDHVDLAYWKRAYPRLEELYLPGRPPGPAGRRACRRHHVLPLAVSSSTPWAGEAGYRTAYTRRLIDRAWHEQEGYADE